MYVVSAKGITEIMSARHEELKKQRTKISKGGGRIVYVPNR